MTTITSREQERRDIIKQYPLTYPLALIGIGLLIGILLGFRLFAAPDSGYAVNLYTTLIDVGLTVGVIEVLSRRRDERRANRERLQELITEMGSKDNAIAIAAAKKLRLKGWLSDGSLQRVLLAHANLQEAWLVGANLQEAILNGSKLRSAVLSDANLEGALLTDVDMRRATLSGANMQEAVLIDANLQGAWLTSANLRGANLARANLQGAKLTDAKIDGQTILPDGTRTSNADMTRFIDPHHPQFWRSDDEHSPAYRGDVP